MRIRSIIGYVWAVASLVVVLATFLGNGPFSRALVAATGIRIAPRYSGGEVIKTIDRGSYRVIVHRPVFDALIGQTSEGFIQLNWEPLAGLPPVIEESVAYSGGDKADFSIRVDTGTGKASLVPINPLVMSVERAVKVDNGWVVRVHLKNQD